MLGPLLRRWWPMRRLRLPSCRAADHGHSSRTTNNWPTGARVDQVAERVTADHDRTRDAPLVAMPPPCTFTTHRGGSLSYGRIGSSIPTRMVKERTAMSPPRLTTAPVTRSTCSLLQPTTAAAARSATKPLAKEFNVKPVQPFTHHFVALELVGHSVNGRCPRRRLGVRRHDARVLGSTPLIEHCTNRRVVSTVAGALHCADCRRRSVRSALSRCRLLTTATSRHRRNSEPGSYTLNSRSNRSTSAVTTSTSCDLNS